MATDTKHFQIYEGNKAVTEQISGGRDEFRSLIKRTPLIFPSDFGESHPFDMEVTEQIYQKFGFVNAIIEKIVEYIWGAGFFIESENENAKAIIEQWMQDVEFPSIGRKWTREALVKGNGFLELGGDLKSGIQGIKILDAKYIYVNRDEKGKIIDFKQLIKGFQRDRDLSKNPLKKDKDFIDFKTENIVHLSLNQIGDNAYGFGIIYSNLQTIDYMLQSLTDMHMLLSRKANSPYDIKLGNLEYGIYPEPGAVTDVGQRLEYLHNKHEWVHGPDMEIKPLEFGNTSDKFQFPMDFDTKLMFFGFQSPETLMGGAVPTGLGSNLATEHGSSWQRHINSYQEEIEKLIEKFIFKRILLSNGFDDYVEIVWGQPNEDEKRQRIQLLQGLINLVTNPALKREIETDITRQLGYDEDLLDEGELERKEEEEREQPFVPGSLSFIPKIKAWLGMKPEIREVKKIDIPENIYQDFPLIEWIGFNYRRYVKDIDNVVDKDDFSNLKAINKDEIAIGYLTENNVKKLKIIMKDTFNKGTSIKTLASTLYSEKIIPDLYRLTNEGEKELILTSEIRSLIVARTETIRLSALGALENYKNNNIQKVRFTAAISDRTCPICEAFNGMVFEITKIPAEVQVPIHVNCRCTYSPVIIE